MTDVVQEKGHGLRFAEQQLKRHGWKHGKGLGRDENGIPEAIKVKVKCNKGGVGHKEGEQFTFHWWDHVFNKASSSLQVESHQDGISFKKMAEDGEEGGGVISNKKPRKASLAKAKLYGCFVKSATLLFGQEQPEPTDDSDSNNSDQEEDHKLDLSSTTKLSDCDLVKACGGRTAHKGARHGLNMSAKLARLEQQEADFMAKYGKKTEDRQEGNESKNKKKISKEKTEELNDHNVLLLEPSDIKIKKKKKKRSDEEETTCAENGDEDHTRKQKKKNGEFTSPELDITPLLEKKKKKKEQQHPIEEEEQINHTESEMLFSERQVKKKSKKSKKDSNISEETQASPPPKKKKSNEQLLVFCSD